MDSTAAGWGSYDRGTSQFEVVATITRISASISGVATLFVLATFMLNPKMRTIRTRILFYISMADLGTITALLVGTSVTTDKSWCYACGAMLNYFVFASCLWTCCFAVCLHRIVQSDRSVEAYERCFHIVAWGGALLLVGSLGGAAQISTGEPMFGPAGAWCWIGETHRMWRLSYLVVMAALVFNVIVYVRVSLNLKKDNHLGAFLGAAGSHLWGGPGRTASAVTDSMDDSFDGMTRATADLDQLERIRQSSEGMEEPMLPAPSSPMRQETPSKASAMLLESQCRRESRATSHYLWYLVAFVVVQLPGFCHRMYQLYTEEESDVQYGLYVLQAVTQPAQGLFTCILYATNHKFIFQLGSRFGEEAEAPRRAPDQATVNVIRDQIRCIDEQVHLLRSAAENLPAASRHSTAQSIASLEQSRERLKRNLVVAEMCQQW